MRLPSQLRILLPFALSGAAVFCNTAPVGATTVISDPVSFINAESSDRWYLVAPYGDAPQKVGDTSVTQRFSLVNAKAIVSDFKGLVSRILELRFGTANLPVLYGHPDDVGWAMANASADQTVYSRIEDMEARPDGLWAKFQPWVEDFSKLPKGLGISPRWVGLPNAEDPKVWEPVKLLSIGLWRTPNIKGTSFVNAVTGLPLTENPADPCPEPVATPTDTLSLSDALRSQVETLNGQVAALTSTITAITNERDLLRTRNQQLSSDYDVKWAESNTYRNALAAALGREMVTFRNAITPAQEADFVASLVNAKTPTELTAILAPLTKAGPTSLPNAHSAAGKVAGRQANPDAATAGADFRAKVGEKQAAGLSYNDAWATVRKEHSALYQSAFPNG